MMTPGDTNRRTYDHLQVYALMLLPEGVRLRQADLPEGTIVAAIRLTGNTFRVVPEAWEDLACQLGRYLREREPLGRPGQRMGA